jgi:ATP-dependent phosphoenolpyruvate carboxykinase
LLDASSTWSSRQEYDLKAGELAGKFRENFAAFADIVAPEVAAAGPQVL